MSQMLTPGRSLQCVHSLVFLAWATSACSDAADPGTSGASDEDADSGAMGDGDTGSTENDAATVDSDDEGGSADIAQDAATDVDGINGDTDAAADDAADAVAPAPRPAVACLQDPECDDIIVVAHRGMHRDPWASIPENSLASIRVAGEVGVPMVEIDVRHTADDVLVVMHDGDLDRTTDGTGNVDTLTWEELQQVRLDGGTEEVPDTLRIPTFAQALEQARVSGVDLYVDVKSDRIALMVQSIVDADMVGHVLFREDEGGALAAYQIEPALSLLIPVDTSEQANALLQQIPELRVVEVVSPIVQPELTAQLRDLGLVVQQDVFVSGDTLWFAGGGTEGWLEYVDAGVQVVQTDYPIQLLQALADR